MAPDVELAIVGAGFSGLGLAIKLKQEAKRSFTILEKNAALGGTWAQNRYPGCACDIPSNLYSYSFAPNPDWTRLYPAQGEIWAYLERCADAFDVRGRIRFNTALTRAVWDDRALLWRIETSAGKPFTARALVSGMGGLHQPNFPDLPGQETFQGQSWHSAQWRDEITLDNKRVAIIGTGASAIQITPAIAGRVAQLDLYQRTPAWIVPRRDRAVSETAKDFYRHAPGLQVAQRRLAYLLHEARAPFFLRAGAGGGPPERLAERHLRAQVPDPQLRAKLTPDYRLGCKRVLVSDDYYPALQRGNVNLIAGGASAITRNGIIDAEGVERPADIILFATGFKPFDILTGVDIIGAGGRNLKQDWAGGAQAFLGLVAAGYPNFFMLMGPNTGLGHNSMIYMIESQFAFIMHALQTLDARNAAALDVKPETQSAFNSELKDKLSRTIWGSGCRSWYLAPDGQNHTLWPDYTFKYRARTKRVRAEDFDFVS